MTDTVITTATPQSVAITTEAENPHLQISPMTRTLYLWTKRGASRHCKMLGTDKAWEMFDVLEKNYFNPKPVLRPVTQAEVSLQLAKVQVEHEKRIQALEVTQDSIQRSVQTNFDICKEAMTVVADYVQNLNKTVQELSGRLDY